jgi:hypothetical protein
VKKLLIKIFLPALVKTSVSLLFHVDESEALVSSGGSRNFDWEEEFA